jgi:hypothetical protein
MTLRIKKANIPTSRGENTKTNYEMDTTREKEKRTSKKNVEGRNTSSHDNKKLRTRSMEKQRGMAFGFRKTATALKNTGWIEILSCKNSYVIETQRLL